MSSTTACKPMKATSNGAFQGDNPLDYAVPLAILQICLVVVVTRSLAFLLKPLRQPRVIAEVIVSSFFSIIQPSFRSLSFLFYNNNLVVNSFFFIMILQSWKGFILSL